MLAIHLHNSGGLGARKCILVKMGCKGFVFVSIIDSISVNVMYIYYTFILSSRQTKQQWGNTGSYLPCSVVFLYKVTSPPTGVACIRFFHALRMCIQGSFRLCLCKNMMKQHFPCLLHHYYVNAQKRCVNH